MVVSFDIYEVISVIELITLIPFGIFIFLHRNETHARVVRLVCSSLLLIFNLVQIPMEIQMGKSYVMTMVLVVMWFIYALTTTFSLGKDS